MLREGLIEGSRSGERGSRPKLNSSRSELPAARLLRDADQVQCFACARAAVANQRGARVQPSAANGGVSLVHVLTLRYHT